MHCLTRLLIPTHTIQQFLIYSMVAPPPNMLPLPARGTLTLGKWSGLVQLAGLPFPQQRTIIHNIRNLYVPVFYHESELTPWLRLQSLDARWNNHCSMPCPSDGMHGKGVCCHPHFHLVIIASSPNNNVLVLFDDRFEFLHDQPIEPHRLPELTRLSHSWQDNN